MSSRYFKEVFLDIFSGSENGVGNRKTAFKKKYLQKMQKYSKKPVKVHVKLILF